MSKLSLIASNSFMNDFDQRIAILNRYLDYLTYIENISQTLCKDYGMVLEQITAYKPEQLINVYFLNFSFKFENYF